MSKTLQGHIYICSYIYIYIYIYICIFKKMTEAPTVGNRSQTRVMPVTYLLTYLHTHYTVL